MGRVGVIAAVLWKRRALQLHEHWARQTLEVYRARAFEELRRFAMARSPFYAVHHRGLERAPLADLPPVTKKELMGRFDEIVTDRALRLEVLEQHLRQGGEDLLHGKYLVATTSGSSGLRAIIPSDSREWSSIVASYARANEWAGIHVSLRHRMRMALVSSRTASHQSARVARTVQSPLVDVLPLDAAQSIDDVTRALNDFQPEVLVAYASVLRMLAEEQLSGRLRIGPRAVSGSSEVLTDETRARVTDAWGVRPFNVYAATETGGIAAECGRGRGMHLFEDLVVVEVVDDDYRAVEPGVAGTRILVTVLHSRTLPLIRYELSDRVVISPEACDCGRPFRLVAAVEGRTDDVLSLPGRGAASRVRVHPVVFHQVLERIRCQGWQVRQQPHGVKVFVAGPSANFEPDKLAASLRQPLGEAGVGSVDVEVDVVPLIPAGASGKRPLVLASQLPEGS